LTLTVYEKQIECEKHKRSEKILREKQYILLLCRDLTRSASAVKYYYTHLMLFTLSAVLARACVGHSVLNNGSSEDGLDALVLVLQGESMRTHNLGRVECCALVTEIGGAGWADKERLRVLDLLTLFAAH